MYVPGKLKNCGKVMVDVGTGYYVEKVRCTNIQTSTCTYVIFRYTVQVLVLT